MFCVETINVHYKTFVMTKLSTLSVLAARMLFFRNFDAGIRLMTLILWLFRIRIAIMSHTFKSYDELVMIEETET